MNRFNLSCALLTISAAALLADCAAQQGGNSITPIAQVPLMSRATTYAWQPGPSPSPYPVADDPYGFVGTVPVELGTANTFFALLNHTDSAGDYAVYEIGLGWVFANAYMTELAVDGQNLTNIWGITKRGNIWSTYPSTTGKWTEYFKGYTSVAVQNPNASNPNGFIFATSSTKVTTGKDGPSGQTIMRFIRNRAYKWPLGKWISTGWGAQQVSADPRSPDNIAALDNASNEWQIFPLITKGGKFLGYGAQQLSNVSCAAKTPLQFSGVAVKQGNYLGLYLDNLGSSGSVWVYSFFKNCFTQLGTRDNFVSISTDAYPLGFKGAPLVYASDTNGKIWIAEQQ